MKRSSDTLDLSQPTRASRAFVGISLVKFVVRFVRQIWPLLLLWVLDPGQITGIILILSVGVLSGISTLYAVISYYNFDYFIRDQALQIRSGVFRRTEQSIPFERIQSIHIEELAMHRLFGVVRLKVETAGSKEEEGIIEALSPVVATQIKQLIEKESRLTATSVDEVEGSNSTSRVFSELNTADLFRIGLTRNHFRTAIILLGFSIGFMEDISELLPSRYTLRWDEEIDRIFDWDPLVTFALFGVFLIVSILITLVTTFFRFYGQRMTGEGDRWTLRSGLISRREWVIPVKKIQEISFTENPFQRWLGIGEIRIKTASSNEVGDEQIIRLSGVQQTLFNELRQSFNFGEETQTELKPYRAFRWRLWFFIGILPGVLLLIPPGITWPIRIILLAIYWVVTFFWTRYLYESYLLRETDQFILIHRGFAWRSIRWTPWQKLQAIQLTRGIYEQRRDLASLVLSHGAGSVSFPFLKKEQALAVMNRGLVRVEQTESDWN